MRVFQLSDFVSLKVNFGHLAMVVCELLVIVVISWLLVLLDLVNGLLWIALLLSL